jgi:hypothetical protein
LNNIIGYISGRNCLLKQEIEGKIEGKVEEKIKGIEKDQEEDISSYCMTSRKREYTVGLKRKQ